MALKIIDRMNISKTFITDEINKRLILDFL